MRVGGRDRGREKERRGKRKMDAINTLLFEVDDTYTKDNVH